MNEKDIKEYLDYLIDDAEKSIEIIKQQIAISASLSGKKIA